MFVSECVSVCLSVCKQNIARAEGSYKDREGASFVGLCDKDQEKRQKGVGCLL